MRRKIKVVFTLFCAFILLFASACSGSGKRMNDDGITVSTEFYDKISYAYNDNALVMKDGLQYLIKAESGKRISDKYVEVYERKGEWLSVLLESGKRAVVDMNSGKSVYTGAQSFELAEGNYILIESGGEKQLYDFVAGKKIADDVNSVRKEDGVICFVKTENSGKSNRYSLVAENGEVVGDFYSFDTIPWWGDNPRYWICVKSETEGYQTRYLRSIVDCKTGQTVFEDYSYYYSSVDHYEYKDGFLIVFEAELRENNRILYVRDAIYDVLFTGDIYPYLSIYSDGQEIFAFSFRDSKSNYYFYDLVKGNLHNVSATDGEYPFYPLGRVSGTSDLCYFYSEGKYHYVSSDGTEYPPTDAAPLCMLGDILVTRQDEGVFNGQYSYMTECGGYFWLHDYYSYSGVLLDKDLNIVVENVDSCTNYSISSFSGEDEQECYLLTKRDPGIGGETKYFVIFNGKISRDFYYAVYDYYGVSHYLRVKETGESGYRCYDVVTDAFLTGEYDDIQFAVVDGIGAAFPDEEEDLVYRYRNPSVLVIGQKYDEEKTFFESTLIKNTDSGKELRFSFDGKSGEVYEGKNGKYVFTTYYADGKIIGARSYDAFSLRLQERIGLEEYFGFKHNVEWVFESSGFDRIYYGIINAQGFYGLCSESGKILIKPVYKELLPNEHVIDGNLRLGFLASRLDSQYLRGISLFGDFEYLDVSGKKLIEESSVMAMHQDGFIILVGKEQRLFKPNGEKIADEVIDFSKVEKAGDNYGYSFFKVSVKGKGYRLITMDISLYLYWYFQY